MTAGKPKADPIFTRGVSLNVAKVKGPFTTEIVRNAAIAFSRNFEDIQLLLNMPISLASQGVIAGRLEETAFVHWVQHLIPKLPPDIQEAAQETCKRELVDKDRALELIHKFATNPVEALAQRQGGDEVLNFIAANPGVRSNFRRLLCSAISAGWTAFESVTTDLWIAIEKSHPTGVLASRAAQKKLTKPQSRGTSLKLLNNFRMLFGHIADFHTGQLESVAAYRDVILHRGERADARFVEKTGVQIQEGELIGLQGEEVVRMLNHTIANTAALLSTADVWVKNHPPESGD